jgi:hypothetical protein
MLKLSEPHHTLITHNTLKIQTATFGDNTFKLLLAMKKIACAPHVQPNESALSCGTENMQHAPNETSSC